MDWAVQEYVNPPVSSCHSQLLHRHPVIIVELGLPFYWRKLTIHCPLFTMTCTPNSDPGPLHALQMVCLPSSLNSLKSVGDEINQENLLDGLCRNLEINKWIWGHWKPTMRKKIALRGDTRGPCRWCDEKGWVFLEQRMWVTKKGECYCEPSLRSGMIGRRYCADGLEVLNRASGSVWRGVWPLETLRMAFSSRGWVGALRWSLI